jgi:prevent-host-death family protein
MRPVSVTELKARLSSYLRLVRRGEEIEILEHGTPVARLVGLRPPPARDKGRIDRLVRAGVLRPAEGDLGWLLSEPPLSIPGAALGEAVAEERREA